MIAKKAGEMFRNQEVVNNKGQIVDQEKFNSAIVKIMEDRYKGGMDKLSNTTKGLWSTVTGVTKSALATIVGMTSDGTIKQGSMLDKTKTKVKQLADRFEKWQSDGTIDKITKKVTTGFNKTITVLTSVWNGAKTTYNFFKDNWGTISNVVLPVVAGFVAFAGTIKVVTSAMKAWQIVTGALTVAQGLLNGTLALTPLGWIAIAIGLVVAAGVLLYKNWDTVKAKALELWEGLKKVWSGIKEGFSSAWDSIKSLGISVLNGYIEKLNKVIDLVNKIPKVNIPKIPTIDIGEKSQKKPRHALGTSYFAGGLTGFSEGGRSESAILPSGSQIIPHDKTNKLLNNGKEIKIDIKIDTFIGTEQFADMIGDKLHNKINLAMANMV
ncbi:phage tail tape measure protein [Schinkia azotoformans]|uniref:hypothetical protein n=1 Tax=Schinkia azotoformans TaxID=1454 RepID=UPI002DB6DE91|nr:hypothetical protein [Schinkia azotoformans]MEC1757374.1 hypothetical protein [Schinkia azotoformans]